MRICSPICFAIVTDYTLGHGLVVARLSSAFFTVSRRDIKLHLLSDFSCGGVYIQNLSRYYHKNGYECTPFIRILMQGIFVC